MPRLLRAADYAVMPWKNGGGTTAEICAEPPGAGLDAFDWRVSMARIDVDGAFSRFPGVDRTLTVLSGTVRLSTLETAVTLDAAAAPYTFAGEAPIMARVLDGPARDLNVFTRRGAFAHRVWRVAAGQGLPSLPSDTARLLFGPDDDCLIHAPGEICADTAGACIVVEIVRAA